MTDRNQSRREYSDLEVRVPKTDLITLLGKLSPSTFKVYMALQSWADFNDKSSYPSVDTIAKRCDLSERTVRAAIKDLSDQKVIRIEHRKDSTGRQTSSTYWIQRVEKSSTPPAKNDMGGVQKMNPGRVSEIAPKGAPEEVAPEEGGSLGDMQREQDVVPERTKPKPPRKTSTAIDDDFWPASPGIEKWATENHVPLSAIHAEVPKFIDHHAAKGSRMVDWDRAFYTWLRNAKSWGHLDPQRNRPAAKGPGKRGYTADELMADYFNSLREGSND